MLNAVPRPLIAFALSAAVGLAFVAPGAADDLHNSTKPGAHDSKHVGGKTASGKALLGKGDKGLGRVDGALAVGVLGLGVLNAITNANAPPAQ